MRDEITADSRMTIPEASATLELPPDVLAGLTKEGPFRADAGGLTVRQAFGASLLLMLPFDVPEAVAIAVAAAQGAEVGGSRSLMLLWPTMKQIVPYWITASDRRPPMPRHLIPVDEMVGLLARHLAAHRAATLRPN